MPKRTVQSLGELGETAAVDYLRRKTYQVIERNVRIHRASVNGEIDIVAVKNRTIVFVEVKTRRSERKGEPWEAVDAAKQERIIGVANAYLAQENLKDQDCRYDIVSVIWGNENRPAEIRHLENAFDEREFHFGFQYDP
ncbi:MAG: YraN family protein [Planctomycetota bacterium]|nr:YraN family protein [Planctomycetota bacterium]